VAQSVEAAKKLNGRLIRQAVDGFLSSALTVKVI